MEMENVAEARLSRDHTPHNNLHNRHQHNQPNHRLPSMDPHLILEDQSCIAREVNRMTTGNDKACYEEEDELRAPVTFDLPVFIENLILQLFNLVPLVLYREGWVGVQNRFYFNLTPMCFFQWLSFLCFYAAIILYIIYQPVNISVAEIALLAIGFFLRQCVVATKHAYMSTPERNERKVKALPVDHLRKQEVLSVWMNLSSEIIEEQLHFASVRKKIDLHKYLFAVPVSEVAEFPEGEESDSRFSAFKVGTEIIHAANAFEAKPYFFPIAGLIALVHGLIPFVVRAISQMPIFGGETWDDVPSILISAFGFLVTTFIMYSNCSFLMAAMLDFRRRRFVNESLDLILTKNVVRTRSYLRQRGLLKGKAAKVGVMDYLDDIRVDLSHPRNVMAWHVLRTVLSNFGWVFYVRLNLYAAYFGVYVILQVVFVILQAFIPQMAVNSVPLILILYSLVIFMALLVLIAAPGGTANEINRLHTFHMVQKKLVTLAYLNGTKDPELENLVKASTTLMDTVVTSVESDNTYNHITILGFAAGGQLAATFFTLAASGAAAVIRSLNN